MLELATANKIAGCVIQQTPASTLDAKERTRNCLSAFMDAVEIPGPPHTGITPMNNFVYMQKNVKIYSEPISVHPACSRLSVTLLGPDWLDVPYTSGYGNIFSMAWKSQKPETHTKDYCMNPRPMFESNGAVCSNYYRCWKNVLGWTVADIPELNHACDIVGKYKTKVVKDMYVEPPETIL